MSLILGIETSCDETAAAVVAGGCELLGSAIASQVALHAPYGGVVPEIASREHLLHINDIIGRALDEAGVTFKDLDAVAVTHGPGLVGALLVGVATAKALAYALGLPLIAVNHLEAHLQAGRLGGNKLAYPAVGLLVSGGHTELLLLEGEEARPRCLGRTRDDAAGEAFDKVARALELGYPGGPLVETLAREGSARAIELPRAWLGEEGRFDFSFSGLKTAVVNHLYHARRRGEEMRAADVAASFQEALVEVLVTKTIWAAEAQKAASVILAGGVAANTYLRQSLTEALARELPGVELHCPPPRLCTDNAAMIAAAAYPLFRQGRFATLTLNAHPGLAAGEEV